MIFTIVMSQNNEMNGNWRIQVAFWLSVGFTMVILFFRDFNLQLKFIISFYLNLLKFIGVWRVNNKR